MTAPERVPFGRIHADIVDFDGALDVIVGRSQRCGDIILRSLHGSGVSAKTAFAASIRVWR